MDCAKNCVHQSLVTNEKEAHIDFSEREEEEEKKRNVRQRRWNKHTYVHWRQHKWTNAESKCSAAAERWSSQATLLPNKKQLFCWSCFIFGISKCSVCLRTLFRFCHHFRLRHRKTRRPLFACPTTQYVTRNRKRLYTCSFNYITPIGYSFHCSDWRSRRLNRSTTFSHS